MPAQFHEEHVFGVGLVHFRGLARIRVWTTERQPASHAHVVQDLEQPLHFLPAENHAKTGPARHEPLRVLQQLPHPALLLQLACGHFEDFFKVLPKREDSPRSWTLDFAARLEKALEETRPHREEAAELDAQAKQLDATLREKKRAKTLSDAKLAALAEELQTVERTARESLAKAESMENAVYDLKAVNPNRTSDEDTRTPAQLLDFIAGKGREADAALARLRNLIA